MSISHILMALLMCQIFLLCSMVNHKAANLKTKVIVLAHALNSVHLDSDHGLCRCMLIMVPSKYEVLYSYVGMNRGFSVSSYQIYICMNVEI